MWLKISGYLILPSCPGIYEMLLEHFKIYRYIYIVYSTIADNYYNVTLRSSALQ